MFVHHRRRMDRWVDDRWDIITDRQMDRRMDGRQVGYIVDRQMMDR